MLVEIPDHALEDFAQMLINEWAKGQAEIAKMGAELEEVKPKINEYEKMIRKALAEKYK
jgi:hypothetical protein